MKILHFVFFVNHYWLGLSGRRNGHIKKNTQMQKNSIQLLSPFEILWRMTSFSLHVTWIVMMQLFALEPIPNSSNLLSEDVDEFIIRRVILALMSGATRLVPVCHVWYSRVQYIYLDHIHHWASKWVLCDSKLSLYTRFNHRSNRVRMKLPISLNGCTLLGVYCRNYYHSQTRLWDKTINTVLNSNNRHVNHINYHILCESSAFV